eukprot:9128235-Ditylum_brightwellii.AAC.1
MPDGRTVAKLETQEYKHHNEFDLQKNCAPKHATRCAEQKEKELPMNAFCLVMDNYFTLPKVIAKLCKIGVGIVGTAYARREWPLKELSIVTQQDANFSVFIWTVNDFSMLVA